MYLFPGKLTRHRTPAHQRNNDPHQIRIPIQTRALEQVRTLAPIPLQHAPQCHRHKRRIPIHQSSRPAQQLEIIREVLFPVVREVLVNRAGQKQDDNHRRGDPHGPIQVGVAFEHVEEVLARVDCRGAAAQDFGGVDVEGLCVEGQRPQVVFAAAGGGRGGARQERGAVGLDFGAAARGWGAVEVWWEG